MNIQEAIDKSKEKELEVRSGGNSKCIIVEDYALLYGSINIDEMDTNIEIVKKAKENGIKVGEILEYKIDSKAKLSDFGENKRYQAGWTLQKKAIGEELYSSDIKRNFYAGKNPEEDKKQYVENMKKYCNRFSQISQASEEHLLEFVKGYDYLNKQKINVDPSKTTNFFYDEDNGFSFIDLLYSRDMIYEDRRKYMAKEIVSILFNYGVPTYSQNYKSTQVMTIEQLQEYKQNHEKLIGKILSVYKSLGISKEEILKRIEGFKEIKTSFYEIEEKEQEERM